MTTSDLILLVGKIHDASMSDELTDRNARLRRIHVCGHTPSRPVDNTERLVHSINHADLTIVFVQAHNVSTLLSLSPKLPTLKIIVAIDGISAAPKELLDAWSQQRKIRVMTLAECKFFLLVPKLNSPYGSSGGDRRQVSNRSSNGHARNGRNGLLCICASSLVYL